MNSWFGRYNIRSNPYSNYDSAPCMNKYHKIKNDIENKIDVFNKISGTNVHKQWDILNRLIMTKDQELKECYEKRYVKVKLNDEEKIKNFKRTCNRNRTCDNQATPAKKTTITKAPEQRNCKDRDSCKNETPARVDVKSQSKLSSAVGNPQRSEIKNPQEQGQNQADVQKLRQESVIPQSQSGSMPSVSSVGTNDKTSQEVVDHHSTTSGMVEPQIQQLDATVHSGNSELGSPLTDNSSQCISGETSDLICPSKEKNLDTRDIKSIQHSCNALDNNHSGSQDSFSKILAGGTGVDKDIIRETPLNLSPTESTSDSVQRAGEDPLPTATDSGSTGSLASDNKNTVSEEISSASLAGAPSSDADTNGITAVDISTNHRAPGGEIYSVKDNHGHSLGNERSCIEPHCSTEKGNELTDNQSDFFGKIFDAISNKDNMVKASAPMGIVLLLGLLFKYTPLWRVLTKKNRKKGAGINEELNSVLQEPSIMDDERSIPFSYGAFEYSSFDQNVY